jgi:hypothetical protein
VAGDAFTVLTYRDRGGSSFATYEFPRPSGGPQFQSPPQYHDTPEQGSLTLVVV